MVAKYSREAHLARLSQMSCCHLVGSLRMYLAQLLTMQAPVYNMLEFSFY